MEFKVAILGSGPSAAYAAKACKDSKIDFTVYSNSAPTMQFPGAFWLRENVSATPIPKRMIHVYSVGTKEKYLLKQWGSYQPEWLMETSFPKEYLTVGGYDPAEVLPQLWHRIPYVFTNNLSDEDVKALATDFDVVFMTFPTEKSRRAMKSYIAKFPVVTFDKTGFSTSGIVPFVIYDGSDTKFTRISYLFGKLHFEYVFRYRIDYGALSSSDAQVKFAPDTKPDTPAWDPMDVPAPNVFLVGRHATWNRKELSHDAYEKVLHIFEIAL